MVGSDYKRARASAVEELKAFLKEKRMVEQRIMQLRQIITALDAFVSPRRKPAEIPRLTDAIRSIFLASSGKRLTPRDIRQKLREIGFDEKRYSNFLASIHVVLRRLKEKGEIAADTEHAGFRPAYRRKDEDEDFIAELEKELEK